MQRLKRVWGQIEKLWGQIKDSWRKSSTVGKLSSIILIVIFISVVGDYFHLGIFGWASVSSKTLWDWLELLIIPVALGLGVWRLERAEREAERRRADDRSRIAALESFLDKITDVLLDPDWRRSEATLAQVKGALWVRTLTTLDRLDGKRKGTVVRFLYLADLIKGDDPVVALREAELSEADLSGVDLREADLSWADLSEADLIGADLRGADLSEANLSGANLVEADLIGADLHGARIDGTTQIDDKWRLVWEIVNQGAQGRDLSQAYLRWAVLSGANLSEADLREADLVGADLIGADLRWAVLIGAYLSQAYLSYAYLSYAYLSRANLREADLREADLREANLSEADLRWADLSGADLSGADLSKITYNDHTKWPKRFTPPPNTPKE